MEGKLQKNVTTNGLGATPKSISSAKKAEKGNRNDKAKPKDPKAINVQAVTPINNHKKAVVKRDPVQSIRCEYLESSITPGGYNRMVKHDSYVGIMRAATHGGPDHPAFSMHYSFFGCPIYADGKYTNVFIKCSLNSSIKTFLTIRKETPLCRLLVSLSRNIINTALPNLTKSDGELHTHDDNTMVKTSDIQFCKTCSLKYLTESYLIGLGLTKDHKGVGPECPEFDRDVLYEICFGFLLSVLVGCNANSIDYSQFKKSFVPRFMATSWISYTIGTKADRPYMFDPHNRVFKSKHYMSTPAFQNLVIYYHMIDYWTLCCLSINALKVGTKSGVSLPIISLPVNNDTMRATGAFYTMPEHITKFYISSVKTYVHMPILRLYVNNRNVMYDVTVYDAIMQYMNAYYACVITHTGDNRQVHYPIKSRRSIDFLERGSIRKNAHDDGIIFVRLGESESKNGTIIYDYHYNFSDPIDDGQGGIVDKTDVVSITQLLNPELLDLLNITVTDVYSNIIKDDELVTNFVWCFEYGLDMFVIEYKGMKIIKNVAPGMSPVEVNLGMYNLSDGKSWGDMMMEEEEISKKLEECMLKVNEIGSKQMGVVPATTISSVFNHVKTHMNERLPNCLDFLLAKQVLTDRLYVTSRGNFHNYKNKNNSHGRSIQKPFTMDRTNFPEL